LANSHDAGIPDSSGDIVLLLDTVHMIEDHDALFGDICRLLKPEFSFFVDPGYMMTINVKSITECIVLFNMLRFDGRNMQIAKAPKMQIEVPQSRRSRNI
jgi:hypothetical protein